MRDELRDAKSNRDAAVALVVFSPAHAPAGIAPFDVRAGDVYCVVDPAAPDAATLEAAVRLARLLALQTLRERDVDVDAAAIAKALEGVREQLETLRVAQADTHFDRDERQGRVRRAGQAPRRHPGPAHRGGGGAAPTAERRGAGRDVRHAVWTAAVLALCSAFAGSPRGPAGARYSSMPRSMWKGAIQFGLVTIPVKMYLATESKGVSFNMLHAACHGRIQMKTYCPTDDEMHRAQRHRARLRGRAGPVRGHHGRRPLGRPAQDRSLDRDRAVRAGGFERPRPPASSSRPTTSSPSPSRARRSSCSSRSWPSRGFGPSARSSCAIASSSPPSIRSPARSCSRPSTGPTRSDPPATCRSRRTMSRPKPAELAMAEQLVGMMTGEFDPAAYHDEYREALMGIIEAKAAGRGDRRTRPRPDGPRHGPRRRPRGKRRRREGRPRRAPNPRPWREAAGVQEVSQAHPGRRPGHGRAARGRDGAGSPPQVRLKFGRQAPPGPNSRRLDHLRPWRPTPATANLCV